ncbi:MAG TPA: type II toxin-antitoxin system VapC family toxin [Vicinamibacterales bacterium]|jgi:predicted nucleic acid-binding protein|nr:type II toxin-antitoxin system VapC family toxin [Vicinamibacterales bacterium]
MATTLVDSNVLLDIATDDAAWSAWSARALERAADESQLAINALIYAEVSVSFSRIEDLEQAVPSTLFKREPIPSEAAFLAGKAFLRYRRRGGIKTTPLPDFVIGAHAAVAGFRILTRDAKRYRTYFPGVEILAP